MESLKEFFAENNFKVWNFVCTCKKCQGKAIHSTPADAVRIAQEFGFNTNAMSATDLYKTLPHMVIQARNA